MIFSERKGSDRFFCVENNACGCTGEDDVGECVCFEAKRKRRVKFLLCFACDRWDGVLLRGVGARYPARAVVETKDPIKGGFGFIECEHWLP